VVMVDQIRRKKEDTPDGQTWGGEVGCPTGAKGGGKTLLKITIKKKKKSGGLLQSGRGKKPAKRGKRAIMGTTIPRKKGTGKRNHAHKKTKTKRWKKAKNKNQKAQTTARAA